MADFAHALGLPTEIGFHDIFGFEPDLLAMVPQPVHAILLLFPITEASEKARLEHAATRNDDAASDDAARVWFTRQTIGNACGTIGVLHAVANTLNEYSVADDSWFGRFFAATRAMTPGERAAHLEADDSLEAAHAGAASSVASSTATPSPEREVDLHFVALVHVDGGLYELDGRRDAPFRHGDTARESFLVDAGSVVKKFVERGGDSLSFNAIAMGPNGGDAMF
uniref:Ubiquitin carboxyl-terminal hydrolase n=1 Tax=Micromonas pusilla TaxID=38833 RepID=A0A7S0NK07_MICPS